MLIFVLIFVGQFVETRSLEIVDSLKVFCKNRRFDLIYKIRWAQAMNLPEEIAKFYRNQYLTSIEHFNGFHEGIRSKFSSGDFLHHFRILFENITKNGFDVGRPVEVSSTFELHSGAHRLAACVVLGKQIAVNIVRNKNPTFDYRFFFLRNLSVADADWGALEYVRMNPHAFVVNVFPVLPTSLDPKVESILNKYGFVYYKKFLQLTYKGCVNLKHINYGKEKWIGNNADNFAGLRAHSEKSMGGENEGIMRVYVFVCEKQSFLISIKKEIRALLNVGNFPVHINDFKEEAIELAQTYFNENSWFVLNHRDIEGSMVDAFVMKFKKYLLLNNYSFDDFCACGSTPMGVLGLRKVNDFDFIHLKNEITKPPDFKLSDNFEELKYYSQTKEAIIIDPKFHFYYCGVKFITLEVLMKMKTKRKYPKDMNDVLTISHFFTQTWNHPKEMNQSARKSSGGKTRKRMHRKIKGKRKMNVSGSKKAQIDL